MKRKKRTLGAVPITIQRKSKKTRWVFLGIGIAATGALSYFGWQYWKKLRAQNAYSPTPSPPPTTASSTVPVPTTVPAYVPTPAPRNDDFPLKSKSKGERVKALQQALMAQGGREILKPYYDDGDFGSVTMSALTKLGYPTQIDENTFNVIVSSGNSIDPAKLAEELYTAITKKNYTNALAALKKIKSTVIYQKVAEKFDAYQIDGVRKTIVTAVLQAFPSSAQKVAIGLALTQAGLKYDKEEDKWSLSGLGETVPMIITLRPTRVWKDPKTSVPVPANMVLGKIITTRGNFSVFENQTRYFLVQTGHVGYYKTN